MRFLPAIIISVSLLLAPFVWHLSARLLSPGGVSGSAVDSSARIEIIEMRDEIQELNQKIETMEATVAALRNRPSTDSSAAEGPTLGGNTGIDTSAYPDVVLIGDRRKINKGLTVPTPSFLESFLGRPRDEINDACQSITDPKLKDMLELKTVGQVKVRMLRPAIESLERVFEKIRISDQELHKRINTAGSLCVRRIRGSKNSLSSHSFGLALDLNINGVLDTLGDGKTQLGLTILADFFRDEGWIWGAGFTREDSMHFEVSRELLEKWRDSSEI